MTAIFGTWRISRRTFARHALGVITPVVLAGLVLAIAVIAASAHEGDDALSAWYRSLKTPEGASCCNMQDCAPGEARQTSDGWEVESSPGEWEPVPADKILHRENMDGRPIICRFGGQLLCFLPPAGA